MLFAAEDIIAHLKQLQSVLEVNVNNYDDQQLLQSKSEIAEYDKTLYTIADRYERLLKFPSCNEKLTNLIKDIGAQYSKIKAMKADFASTIHSIIASREIIKYKSFDKTKLGIDLKKFSGYDSTSDIYTFKSNFEQAQCIMDLPDDDQIKNRREKMKWHNM